jgi:hypothetical protein
LFDKITSPTNNLRKTHDSCKLLRPFNPVRGFGPVKNFGWKTIFLQCLLKSGAALEYSSGLLASTSVCH